jgi:hypothetical protein
MKTTEKLSFALFILLVLGTCGGYIIMGIEASKQHFDMIINVLVYTALLIGFSVSTIGGYLGIRAALKHMADSENLQKENWNMQDKTGKQSDSSNNQKIGVIQKTRCDILNREVIQTPESLASTEMLQELIVTKLCNQPPIHKCTNPEHYSHKTTSSVCRECLAEQIISICQSIIAKTERQKAFREVGEWIDKNDNHFIFKFIPECGADLCFLATEGFENEVPEPDEGAGYCLKRDQCRWANKHLLAGNKFRMLLKSGQLPRED